MLVSMNGEASNKAGDNHYPVEVVYETRFGTPGFWVDLYVPETYHKSVLEIGPFGTIMEATRWAEGDLLIHNWFDVVDLIENKSGYSNVYGLILDIMTPLKGRDAVRASGVTDELLGRYEAEIKQWEIEHGFTE